MSFVDRLLLVTAALSGVLVTRGPALADPDPVVCVDTCQQTQRYYDCVKDHAYEYELDDCYHCSATGSGACATRATMPGGTCTKRDMLRKWRYIQDYTNVCTCEGWTSRIEVSGGVNFTNWDVFDGDFYYVCIVSKK